MTFQILKFLKDHRIPYADHTESAKVSAGWIGVCCPFCDDDNYKLGYRSGAWTCWQCGNHRPWETISRLCSVSIERAREIYSKYQGEGESRSQRRTERSSGISADTVSFPHYVKPLQEPHKAFLRSRNFDPDKIEREWLIKGTGPIPHNPQQLRIMIPVMFGGLMMCYQGRDITDRATAKYWSLPRELSARPIKSCLYGYDNARRYDTVVACEGPTDVWRLGPGAVALFGVAHRPAQVALLAHWKRVVVLLDADSAGRYGAQTIASELSIAGREVEIVKLPHGDPADLSDEDAKNLMAELR